MRHTLIWGHSAVVEGQRGTKLLILFALVCALTSCGPSVESKSGQRTVIRYWEKWTGFEADAMRKVVDDFNASQDRIYVDFSSVSQVDRKFMLSTAGGVPPDIAGIWSVSLPIYAENNALTPLDKLAAEAGVHRADYLDAYWQLCSYRDHLWALPSTPASVGLVWNKKMFREAGLDPERPPRSIAELEAFNAKLTRYRPDGHLDHLGFLPAEPISWSAMWGYWFGATLWNGQGKITIDSPENVAAYRWVQSYPERFGADRLLAFRDGFGNAASPQDPFLSGRLAMELQGVWIYNFIKAYAPPDFEWGAAPFPSVDPGEQPGFGLVETDVLVVPAGAKHPRESFEFIRYVNSQKPMEKLCLGQLKFSPLRTVSPDFIAKHPNPHIADFLALAQDEHAHYAPRLATWSEYASDMDNAVSQIVAGKETASDALAVAQRQQQRSLNHQLERWNRLSTRLLAEWGQEP